jgi:RNA polymerase sigma factor (sigma-70 family)
MASRQLGVVVEQLRRLTEQAQHKHLPDQQLVDLFVRDHSEAAFQTLIGRHGPMVLGVCGRVLSQPEDVEDAFQATFLVLVRKAASLRRGGSVRNWLYGVACRTAARAKVDAAKRRAREASLPPRVPADTLAEITVRELLTVLDEELCRLPEKHQGPLLLCYLDGKTRDEAAAELGWSLATLGRRLERGRELLRARLARRGIALPAALVPLLLIESGARAAVPMALATSTTKAASHIVAGSSAATVVSARVVALAEGVFRTMWTTKLQYVIVLFLAFGFLGAGAALIAQPRNASPRDEPKIQDEAKAAGKDQAAADRARLRGEWIFDSAMSGEALDGRQQDIINQFWESRMTFAGDEFRLSNIRVSTQQGPQKFNVTARFVLDPSHQPHHIDLVFKDEASLSAIPSGTLKGIYQLEGDTLKLCLPVKGDQVRPGEFKASPGSNRHLVVLKRMPKQSLGDEGGKKEQGFTVRAVDTDGKPVVLAKVGSHADFNILGLGLEWTYWHQMITGENGVAHSHEPPEGWLIARHNGRNLVAIEKVTPYRLLSGPITLTMQPACRVSGRLTCPELEHRKIDLGFTAVCAFPDGIPCNYRCGSEEGAFHFYLPPGNYTLDASGDKVLSVHEPLTVEPGQRELQVDIEFPRPRRLATLMGTPAPELTEIAAWKNGPPVKLADLRGKCVLLVFWMISCPPCLQEMPALFELQDQYREDGLVVLGVHVDTSSDGKADTVEKLDGFLAKVKDRLWKGKDIPFPVALAKHREVRYGTDVHEKAPCKVVADYGVTFFPTHVLIDRQGRISADNIDVSSEAGKALLKKLLQQK